MKTWKLVSGILSTVIFLVVMFQSCAAGIVDAIENAGGTSGAAGIVVGILMLSGGIVSIVTRDSAKKGGDIALMILFGLAAFFGFVGYGNYSDLVIWSFWCLICAILALVSMVKKG
ncbi:MAG: hypothetical protein HFH91_06435 [Lachnospiraceae bacterium]|nr:hypothetical protein [Lachnospiraceae bacterium]